MIRLMNRLVYLIAFFVTAMIPTVLPAALSPEDKATTARAYRHLSQTLQDVDRQIHQTNIVLHELRKRENLPNWVITGIQNAQAQMRHSRTQLENITLEIGQDTAIGFPESGIPVVDVVAILQAVLHFVERLYEIFQKAEQIANQYIMIANQYEQIAYDLTNLDPFPGEPFADPIQPAEDIYNQGLNLKELHPTELYGGLYYSLEDAYHEMHETFPGYVPLPEGPTFVRYDGRIIPLANAREFVTYQNERLRRTFRGLLSQVRTYENRAVAAQVHLADVLNPAAKDSQGNLSAFQVMMAYLSHIGTQLTVISGQDMLATNAAILEQTRETNESLQSDATYEWLNENAADDNGGLFGEVIPPLNNNHVLILNGLPHWY